MKQKIEIKDYNFVEMLINILHEALKQNVINFTEVNNKMPVLDILITVHTNHKKILEPSLLNLIHISEHMFPGTPYYYHQKQLYEDSKGQHGNYNLELQKLIILYNDIETRCYSPDVDKVIKKVAI